MSDTPRVQERRITQIAVSPGAGHRDTLFALCNDGTVWRLAVKLDYDWFRLPDVPVGEPTPTGTASVAI